MLKLVVTALRRYWALGRCFDAGETEVDVDEALLPSVLAQLDAARGGQVLEANFLDRGNPPEKAPCVLSYRVVAEVVAAPEPAPEPEPVRMSAPEPDAPPAPEVMHDPAANAED